MSSIAQRCLQLRQGAVVVTMSAPLALFLPAANNEEHTTNPNAAAGGSRPEATDVLSLPSSVSQSQRDEEPRGQG